MKRIFARQTESPQYSKKFIFCQLALLIFCFLLLFGCATPQVTVNPDMKVENYKNYKIVYLPTPDSDQEDPRNVFPQVIERLEGLGFTVHPVNAENPIEGAQGTGFIIDPKGFILTCAHLFGKEKEATVWLKGKRYEADVEDIDEEKDLALLQIKQGQVSDLKALPVSEDPAYKMGQDVYTIGFPLSDILGNSPRLNKGLISSTVGLKDNPDHLQISVEIQPGNSGSPLVNENGAVIGIIQETLNPMSVLARTGGNLPQNVNFAAKTNIIIDFINKNTKEVSINFDTSKKLEFDQVSNSVAQIRAGNITEEFLKQPKMVCKVFYRSMWDIWFRFVIFHMEFYDFETGKLLFKAGQYGDNPLSTEEKIMDQTFEQIRNQFEIKGAPKKQTGS